MNAKSISTRRGFFWKAGAALSAPLAAATAVASGGDDDAGALKARIAELEDIGAIRALNRDFARLVNARAGRQLAELFTDPTRSPIDESVAGLSTDRVAEDDTIRLAPDRRSATAAIYCVVELETAIAPGCTLVAMARAQGEGVVRRTERRVLEGRYVKQGGVWKIERADFRAA